MIDVRPQANIQKNDLWFDRPDSRKDARMRLFCFPYSGGSPSMFRSWAEQLPRYVEVLAVRLPGRDMRIREAPFMEWPLLLDATEAAITPYFDKPFIFFGHSLGARIAYELTWRLQEHNKPLPKQLLVAGCRCPHISHHGRYIHSLPEKEFLECLRRMGGTPPEVLADKRLMTIFGPTIRADMKLAEVWGGTVREPVNVTIVAFAGMEDDIASADKMLGWESYSNVNFAFYTLPGNHFFINSSETLLLNLIANICLSV